MSGLPGIVCISTNDWTGLPTSKQHLMSLLAERTSVLYVDPPIDVFSVLGRRRRWPKLRGLRRTADGLWVLSPIVMNNSASRRPGLHTRTRARAVSAARAIGLRRPVLWTFDPSHASYVGAFDERAAVYHIADDPVSKSRDPSTVLARERRHIESVDLVFAVSAALARERRWSGKVRRLPNAADARHFGRVLGWAPGSAPADVLAALRQVGERPRDLPAEGRVVLFGGAAYEWFDEELFAAAARLLPDVAFVVVGPAGPSARAAGHPPNVRFLGRKPYDVYPRYVAAADCAVIPLKPGRVAEHCDAIVVYEYLLCGKPVAATPFPAVLERGELVRTGDAPGSFAAAIRAGLDEAGDDEAALRRISFGLANTWEDRAEEAVQAILSIPDDVSGPDRRGTR